MPIRRMLEGRNFDPKAIAILVEAFDAMVAELDCGPSPIGKGPQKSSSRLRARRRLLTRQSSATRPSA
jgi:hypothetical protein